MALINDLINELTGARTVEQARVDGGSDLLDIRVGPSVLSAETVAVLEEKLAYETEQLNLIVLALSSLEALAEHGFPDRKVFDVSVDIAEELIVKQRQMLDFSNEFRSVVIGADGGSINKA